jgi:hypothetical protein
LDEQLTLTNVLADFYGGNARGNAQFDFHPRQGTDIRFSARTTNTVLQLLMSDLVSHTNHLEGKLNADLHVTRANSIDLATVNGYGQLDLRDGLIWDIPLFGILSDVLNGVAPGLGNTRAKAATCSFAITNGVVRSDDLDIRSSPFRLQYRGTVDLHGQVNAKVEAELLRDMWVVGPIVSTVFWPVTKIFEYKVSGSLAEPKMDPVFILPKILLFPFHPFRSLKDILPDSSASSRTNAPPQF